MLIILGLALVLLLLLARPKRKAPQPMKPPLRRGDDDTLIYGHTPNGTWEGGKLPEGFTPGGGNFGGAGSSGSWDSSDGGSGTPSGSTASA